jgi:dienelactone hydrolase
MRRVLRKFACRYFAVAALSSLALTGRSSASAAELVKFDSASLRSRQGEEHSDHTGTNLPGGKPDIQGYLTRPKGSGPFPAVVLLHSCLGLPANRAAIGDMVASWGYVALFVDDFATRGVKETCAVDFGEALSDAFGALNYLSRLPYVDPTRIAAVGYSQGADTALKIASARFSSAFAVRDDLKFKVAAAFYPPCENLAGAKLEIPTLILIGESDEVTPMTDCRQLAQRPDNRSAVKLVVYPGADHGFDNPGFVGGARLFGMLLKYDRGAAEESKSELRDFLTAKLGR